MKAKVHAIVAMLAIFLISASLISTLIFALFVDSPSAIVSLKSIIFRGTFPLVLALLILGASGMSLLGKRTDSLALTKQKRGPIGFMTSLLVLLPSAYFLARWSAAGSFGTLYFIIQGVSIIASFVVFAMVALNIRDGLKLTGKIASAQKMQAPISTNAMMAHSSPLPFPN